MEGKPDGKRDGNVNRITGGIIGPIGTQRWYQLLRNQLLVQRVVATLSSLWHSLEKAPPPAPFTSPLSKFAWVYEPSANLVRKAASTTSSRHRGTSAWNLEPKFYPRSHPPQRDLRGGEIATPPASI